MKIKDLVNYIYDRVVIYTGSNGEFTDLFEGNVKDIPVNILEMEIRSIGSFKKGLVDLQVISQ